MASVLCALLCPGPCFPSSPEEMQRCFWNVTLDNSGYQVTFHLAIQTGCMSQGKGRPVVGEGEKSHRGEQSKKKGDDMRSFRRQRPGNLDPASSASEPMFF